MDGNKAYKILLNERFIFPGVCFASNVLAQGFLLQIFFILSGFFSLTAWSRQIRCRWKWKAVNKCLFRRSVECFLLFKCRHHTLTHTHNTHMCVICEIVHVILWYAYFKASHKFQSKRICVFAGVPKRIKLNMIHRVSVKWMEKPKTMEKWGLFFTEIIIICVLHSYVILAGIFLWELRNETQSDAFQRNFPCVP